jgi:hypothetical protein
VFQSSSPFTSGMSSASFVPVTTSSPPGFNTIRSDSEQSYNGYAGSSSFPTQPLPSYGLNPSTSSWDSQGRISPEEYMDDFNAFPSTAEYAYESSSKYQKPRDTKGQPQRRPSNRDEFDGPHQFLQRPPPEVIAMQERDLPHLPTNLLVHEQDDILARVNDRLSLCAFDFVAKYQFPIPLTNGEMRPVERPQDREWTEWVYLLKRLATKRRIPARVLYNGQIKQFITILENSLEMRHAAKHQSRPLKDDRNVLQLISAGIQVAKLLKDADAMSYMDQLYFQTERLIQSRIEAQRPKFGFVGL